MVEFQLEARGIGDERVLAAMGKVPRHEFVPAAYRAKAYSDQALPIGRGQTISQPYVVALMTQVLELRGDERVLEVGTGSGYQAAVLARLARSVYSIEIDRELAAEAARRLERLGYDNVHVRAGDGFFGWPEAAPFDAILITAATPRLPDRLVDQLAEGGRLVAPVGAGGEQELTLAIKRDGTLHRRSLGGVLFVPMTGEVRRGETKGPGKDVSP
jgi:protein-L-isoaspartate(D-aspartate) O-methyltransferase